MVRSPIGIGGAGHPTTSERYNDAAPVVNIAVCFVNTSASPSLGGGNSAEPSSVSDQDPAPFAPPFTGTHHRLMPWLSAGSSTAYP